MGRLSWLFCGGRGGRPTDYMDPHRWRTFQDHEQRTRQMALVTCDTERSDLITGEEQGGKGGWALPKAMVNCLGQDWLKS